MVYIYIPPDLNQLSILGREKKDSEVIHNSFDRGPEGWCSHDYHWSVVDGGANIFILTTWEKRGGVNDTGFVWSDETHWSADTPESPISVFPFLLYRSWTGLNPLDLRGSQISV